MNRNGHLRALAAALLLASGVSAAAELDVTLTTTLDGVAAVKLQAAPVEGDGPSASLHIDKPSDLRASGGQKVADALVLPDPSVSGWFSYSLKVQLFDARGSALPLSADSQTAATTVVDIYIDGDCADCGDTDFSFPIWKGSKPSAVNGRVDILPDGAVRWHLATSGNDPNRPAASASIEVVGGLSPDAPVFSKNKVVVALDRLQRSFKDTLISAVDFPHAKPYQVSTSWLDAKGSQIGATEVFSTVPEVVKTRKDGTLVYRPWRLHSDLSVVVGESWELSSVTDTYLDAVAFEYSLVPLDGGPKPERETTTLLGQDELLGKALARDVTLAGPMQVGQVLTVSGRALDASGKELFKGTWVLDVVNDPDKGLMAISRKNGDVAPLYKTEVSVRYRSSSTEGQPAVVVAVRDVVTTVPASTFELSVIPDQSTVPALQQQGQAVGFIKAPVEIQQVFFRTTFALLFTPTSCEERCNYQLEFGWLNSSGKLIAPVETVPLRLEPKGDRWVWKESTPSTSIEIR